jgi:hypothetical protein
VPSRTSRVLLGLGFLACRHGRPPGLVRLSIRPPGAVAELHALNRGRPSTESSGPRSQGPCRKGHGPFEIETPERPHTSPRQISRPEQLEKRDHGAMWTSLDAIARPLLLACSPKAAALCASQFGVLRRPLLATSPRDVPARSPAGLQRLTADLRRGPAARMVYQVCDEYRLILVGKITTDSAGKDSASTTRWPASVIWPSTVRGPPAACSAATGGSRVFVG